MKHLKIARYVLVFLTTAVFFPLPAWAEERMPAPETYMPHPTKFRDVKRPTDDPRDIMATYPLKDNVPSEIWSKITFDQEKMKKGSVELFGFSSPELVGKLSPEIKPGKYTYSGKNIRDSRT